MLQLVALLSATKRALQTHVAAVAVAAAPTAPPPSPAGSPVHGSLPARRGRRPRVGLQLSAPKLRRQSRRLAEKAKGMFEDTTDKAVQLKALKNALVPCSAQLKKAVDKKNLLARSKLPIAPAELRRLVAAAGIGGSAAVPAALP